jgi:N-acyl-phosphatidylethanolamine-hydrolysing phospholipase D
MNDFSERCSMASFIGPKRFRPPALLINDLPDDLDAIFISHNHFDHLDYPSVKELNKRYGKQLTWFCGRGTRKWFLDNYVKNIVDLDWWEEYYFAVRKDSF